MLEKPELVVGLCTVQHADSMAVSCSLFPKSPSILFPRNSRFFCKTKVDTEIFSFLSFPDLPFLHYCQTWHLMPD